MLISVLSFALNFYLCAAHIPFLDNGKHTAFSSAFVYTDETIARSLNINVECDGIPHYSKVTVQNMTSFHVGMGIPNVTELYDYRPALWVIGKNVIVPDQYSTSWSDAATTPGIHIPQECKGYRVSTEVSETFREFGEGANVSGVILMGLTVNVTNPGDVYLVVEPEIGRRARIWTAVGTKEVEEKENGQATDIEVSSWYDSNTFPLLGTYCMNTKVVPSF